MEQDAQVIAEIENQMRLYLKHYCEGLFNSLTKGQPIDYDALGFWTFPMLQIAGEVNGQLMSVDGGADGTTVGIKSRAVFDEMAHTLYRQYIKDGWAGGPVEVEKANVTLVSPAIATAEVHGVRYRPDRSVFNRYHAMYWLQKTDAGWKQFGVTDVVPPRPVPDQWVEWFASFVGVRG